MFSFVRRNLQSGKMRPFHFVLWTAICFFILGDNLYAAESGSGEISWKFLIFGMAGGLAFFLFGMETMSSGMKRSAGNRMRSILAALTKNRFIALIVGAFVTMVIQSSSATTVMLVGFAQSGLMTLAQSLGVILGADIGTTVTAQMIAFKLTDYALLLTAAGFLIRLVAKTENTRNLGEILFGFGVLFFGMKLMSDAMKPLRDYGPFLHMMQNLEHPLSGLLAGAVFTALVQSSSASTGVVIVLAQQGLITLEAGIPVIFGANIGTCVTAGLASIGADLEAKRVALAHVLFKVAGVFLFIFWIPAFAELIRDIASRFGSGTARQIANAHTLFNVGVGLFFLPFIGIFEKAIEKLLPDRTEERDAKLTTLHLDESIIQTPALAMDIARAEISHMSRTLGRMLKAIIIPFMSDAARIIREEKKGGEAALLVCEIPTRDEVYPELSLLEGIDYREEKLDFLEEEIIDYLVLIARQNLSEGQTTEVFGMISIIKDMESIGDLIHRNMVPLIARKNDLDYDFSMEGKEELMIYHVKALKQISRLTEAFAETDPATAMKIMKKERKYLDLESKYRANHLKRIVLAREESIGTHEIHMELMDLMKQIVVYCANIAQTFLATGRDGKRESRAPHPGKKLKPYSE